ASGGTDPLAVVLGDVNGDGKLDIIVANAASNNIAVLAGDGSGGFASAVAYDSGGVAPVSVAVGTVRAQSAAVTEDAQGPGAGSEAASGTIPFTDVDASDIHTASFAAQNNGAGYVGSFTLDPITQDSSNGAIGQLGWHFSVDDSAIDYLAAGQTLTQKYDVTI